MNRNGTPLTDGTLIEGIGLCNTIEEQPIPEDAANVTVFIGSDAYMENVWDFSCGTNAVPTFGFFTLSFE